jgi:uracil-DNA glycosylase family 4
MFIDGCVERKTVSAEGAGRIFDTLKHFGSYGFNRAHAVEYAMIAYWDMWMKVHYPTEFMVAILSYGQGGDKKADHVAEARRMGVKIKLPDINKSGSYVWRVDEEGNLRIPFQEIKGIGPKSAEAIVKAREEIGEFRDKDHFLASVPKRQVNSRIVGILERVGAFGDVDQDNLSEQELEELSELFEFDLSNDPMYRFRKVIKVILDQIQLSYIKDITISKEPDLKYYWGQIKNIRFGYKEKVKGTKEGQDATGLGGVYGNYFDDTDFAMLTFGTDIYGERKYEIEHCGDKWLLTKANSPYPNQNLYTDQVWFGEDLLAGYVKGLSINLAKSAVYPEGFPTIFSVDGRGDLPNCTKCNLRQECNAPVCPSRGSTNVVIAGEAPGFNEDKDGIGFVGEAGNLMWRGSSARGIEGLSYYGLDRSMFHVTNIVKCYPKITKTPKKSHINTCSVWFDKEMRIVKPYIVYAVGNTCMTFFKGVDSGIMAQVENSPTEWNDKYNCWICWNVHPASVLYSPENKQLYEKGLLNFVEKLSNLGYGNGA